MQIGGKSESESDLWLQKAGIRRVFVDQLFGTLRYNLSSAELRVDTSARVVLLYGENGSGKTTILKLLFFLLSHVDRKGHKNQIRKIPFKAFEVEFADGKKVLATREDYRQASYTVRAFDGSYLVAEVYYNERFVTSRTPLTDAELRNPVRDWEQGGNLLTSIEDSEQKHHELLAFLESLDLGLLYVTDQRKTFTTRHDFNESRQLRKSAARRSQAHGSDSSLPGGESEVSLQESIDRIGSWATQRAFEGSYEGESDVNSVYLNVLERLGRSGQEMMSKDLNVLEVLSDLETLEKRSIDFAEFGLANRLDLRPMIESLRVLHASTLPMALSVLVPYVTSLKARFAALEKTRAQLTQFVATLQAFLKTKTIRLNVQSGLNIFNTKGEPLSPAMLSSGERQILFLLANTLVARESSGLIIIDEPELSLNVTWQRKLVRSLLDMTKGTKIQFFMATHSVEMLTRYDDLVWDLDPLSEQA